jgi:hypothetical protein
MVFFEPERPILRVLPWYVVAADQLIHGMDLTFLSPMCRWFDNEHDLATSTNAGEDSGIQKVGLIVSSLSMVGMLIGEDTRGSRRKWDSKFLTVKWCGM